MRKPVFQVPRLRSFMINTAILTLLSVTSPSADMPANYMVDEVRGKFQVVADVAASHMVEVAKVRPFTDGGTLVVTFSNGIGSARYPLTYRYLDLTLKQKSEGHISP